MTFLSRFPSGLPRAKWLHCELVRSSHSHALLVAALFVSGCLVQEPPVWDSKPSPPVLMDFTPPTGKIVVVDLPQQQAFTFAEVSEDQGQPLRVVWYLNYGIAKQEAYINNRDYPAADSNLSKTIAIDWTPVEKMCAPFTIMVTHADNVVNDDFHHPRDPSDAAFVTWLVSVRNKGDELDLTNCPNNLGGTSP
jgi:hypothetical protein